MLVVPSEGEWLNHIDQQQTTPKGELVIFLPQIPNGGPNIIIPTASSPHLSTTTSSEEGHDLLR
jgi:hypothetical protein